MKTQQILSSVLLGVFLLGPASAAQTRKAFEAVSIRPEDPGGSSRPSSRLSANRFELVAIRPWEMVARAFGIPERQVLRIDIPEWTKRERFAIRALMPAGTTERDIPEMLKTLLEERFHLRTRVEQRPFPLYELVVLPSGPKLREVAAADDLKRPFVNPGGGAAIFDVVNGLPGDELRTIQAPAGPGSPATLHYVTSRTSYALNVLSGGVRQIDAARITMAEFASAIGPSADRPVVDKTGLTGIYQFKILLPPARISPAMQALLGDRLDKTPSGISTSRSLEEFGLKLEPKDGPVDFIIVENIERPLAD
jgi:uncharacterized protein (TIGR03435 family)